MVEPPRRLPPTQVERADTIADTMTGGGAQGRSRTVRPIPPVAVNTPPDLQAKASGSLPPFYEDQWIEATTDRSTYRLTYIPLPFGEDVQVNGIRVERSLAWVQSEGVLTVVNSDLFYVGDGPWWVSVHYPYDGSAGPVSVPGANNPPGETFSGWETVTLTVGSEDDGTGNIQYVPLAPDFPYTRPLFGSWAMTVQATCSVDYLDGYPAPDAAGPECDAVNVGQSWSGVDFDWPTTPYGLFSPPALTPGPYQTLPDPITHSGSTLAAGLSQTVYSTIVGVGPLVWTTSTIRKKAVLEISLPSSRDVARMLEHAAVPAGTGPGDDDWSDIEWEWERTPSTLIPTSITFTWEDVESVIDGGGEVLLYARWEDGSSLSDVGWPWTNSVPPGCWPAGAFSIPETPSGPIDTTFTIDLTFAPPAPWTGETGAPTLYVLVYVDDPEVFTLDPFTEDSTGTMVSGTLSWATGTYTQRFRRFHPTWVVDPVPTDGVISVIGFTGDGGDGLATLDGSGTPLQIEAAGFDPSAVRGFTRPDGRAGDSVVLAVRNGSTLDLVYVTVGADGSFTTSTGYAAVAVSGFLPRICGNDTDTMLVLTTSDEWKAVAAGGGVTTITGLPTSADCVPYADGYRYAIIDWTTSTPVIRFYTLSGATAVEDAAIYPPFGVDYDAINAAHVWVDDYITAVFTTVALTPGAALDVSVYENRTGNHRFTTRLTQDSGGSWWPSSSRFGKSADGLYVVTYSRTPDEVPTGYEGDSQFVQQVIDGDVGSLSGETLLSTSQDATINGLIRADRVTLEPLEKSVRTFPGSDLDVYQRPRLVILDGGGEPGMVPLTFLTGDTPWVSFLVGVRLGGSL